MRVTCANHSSLSFPSASPSDADLDAALRVQEQAGLDVLTDGQPNWADCATPMLALDGIRPGAPAALPLGLSVASRPVVQAKLRRHHSPTVAAYRRSAPRAQRPLKAVLTGPFTLAHTAEIATTAYRHRADLAADLSTLLAQDVTALVAAGAPAIQIDEPLLLAHPEAARLLRSLLEPLVDAAGGAATIIVATYGADAGACYAQLNSLPGDIIAVECTGHPALLTAISETGSGKPLALGIVDGASAHTESRDQLAALLERLLRRYTHDLVWLQPGRGMRTLDRSTAAAKLAALAHAGRTLQGGAAS
jgi:5-methyltetrahydropteroyltriglutamate--homocysteine methyltransferase